MYRVVFTEMNYQVLKTLKTLKVIEFGKAHVAENIFFFEWEGFEPPKISPLLCSVCSIINFFLQVRSVKNVK